MISMFQEFPVQVFNGCLLSISLKASEDSWKLNCSHLHGHWGTPRRIRALLSSSSAFREIRLIAATFLTPNHPPRSLKAAKGGAALLFLRAGCEEGRPPAPSQLWPFRAQGRTARSRAAPRGAFFFQAILYWLVFILPYLTCETRIFL